MNQSGLIKLVSIVLIVSPIILIAFRISANQDFRELTPGHKYVVNYHFEVSGNPEYRFRTFLPVNNQRQTIFFPSNSENAKSTIALEGDNKIIRWKGLSDSTLTVKYTFEHRGKPVIFSIDPALTYVPNTDPSLADYLRPTSLIQSDDQRIQELAYRLKADHTSTVAILKAFFDLVFSIPSASTSQLTDALMALENYEASCNGKSRLFVALCRSVNIPARVTGGLILEDTRKKTSHLWAEVLVSDQWIPFDALNGHFASLPANYLELYKGDEFLITRSGNTDFNYIYEIQKERINHFPELAAINLWEIIDHAKIPVDLLRMILLLPFGALLVAIFKNVIGIKTYAVFLPVLISLALIETGLLPGLVLFSVIITVVALVNFPLEKWGVQHNAKVAMMLTVVVMFALLVVKVLYQTEWLNASAPLFFPIIILTIVSERFAKKIEEEGLKPAVVLYLLTLLVTVVIYFILSSEAIQYFVITFPEIIVSVAGLNLMLGKWIGLRLSEYYRFHKVINAR
ncbi:MAG: 7TM domain-containing protein [Bacteroidota bacterium]